MGAGRFGPPCAKRSLILVRPNVARAGGPAGAPPGIGPAAALELIFIVSLTTFAGLGLAESLLAALDRQGFHTPTPIQSGAIPALLAGRDLLGVAQTGSGKTAAFGLPLLQHLAARPSRPQPQTTTALILAPTRELALQIEESLRTLGGGSGSACSPSSAAARAMPRCSGCAPASTSSSAPPGGSAT